MAPFPEYKCVHIKEHVCAHSQPHWWTYLLQKGVWVSEQGRLWCSYSWNEGCEAPLDETVKVTEENSRGIPKNSNPTQPSVLKAACLTIRGDYFICSSRYKSGTRYRSILNHPKLQQRHFMSLFWNGVICISPVVFNSRWWKVMCLSDTPSLTPHSTQRQTFEPITVMEIVHLVLEIWIVGIFYF